MNDFQLSPHFRYFELTDSASHPDLVSDNRMVAWPMVADGQFLCSSILEPLRAKFGPLKVESGFRSKSLNTAVGGSPTSQHCLFQAADINLISDGSDAAKANMGKWLEKAGIAFGQALIEGGCLHVSLQGKHVRQIGRAAKVAGVWQVVPFETLS